MKGRFKMSDLKLYDNFCENGKKLKAHCHCWVLDNKEYDCTELLEKYDTNNEVPTNKCPGIKLHRFMRLAREAGDPLGYAPSK